jgi:hypothetical protein
VKLEWSDRHHWVHPDDLEAIADCVMYCALDHTYDRTSDGVPWGVPDAWRPVLAAVVDRHASAACPGWSDARRPKRVEVLDDQRAAFVADLLSALRELCPEVSRGTTLDAPPVEVAPPSVWAWRDPGARLWALRQDGGYFFPFAVDCCDAADASDERLSFVRRTCDRRDEYRRGRVSPESPLVYARTLLAVRVGAGADGG